MGWYGLPFGFLRQAVISAMVRAPCSGWVIDHSFAISFMPFKWWACAPYTCVRTSSRLNATIARNFRSLPRNYEVYKIQLSANLATRVSTGDKLQVKPCLVHDMLNQKGQSVILHTKPLSRMLLCFVEPTLDSRCPICHSFDLKEACSCSVTGWCTQYSVNAQALLDYKTNFQYYQCMLCCQH